MSPRRAHRRGQSSIEYLIGVSLLSLAIAVGPDSPLDRLQAAFRTAWAGFTYSVSMP